MSRHIGPACATAKSRSANKSVTQKVFSTRSNDGKTMTRILGNLRGPRLSYFFSSRWSVFIWITANLTNETRRPSLILLGDGIRPKRNSVYSRKEQRDAKRKQKKRIKKTHKKKKNLGPAIPDQYPPQTEKDQRTRSFLFWLALDSFFPRYPFLTITTLFTTLSPSTSTTPHNLFIPHFLPISGWVFILPRPLQAVFLVRLRFLVCFSVQYFFIFCVSEHTSLLEDCPDSKLK